MPLLTLRIASGDSAGGLQRTASCVGVLCGSGGGARRPPASRSWRRGRQRGSVPLASFSDDDADDARGVPAAEAWVGAAAGPSVLRGQRGVDVADRKRFCSAADGAGCGGWGGRCRSSRSECTPQRAQADHWFQVIVVNSSCVDDRPHGAVQKSDPSVITAEANNLIRTREFDIVSRTTSLQP